jgi:hypothetical protein
MDHHESYTDGGSEEEESSKGASHPALRVVQVCMANSQENNARNTGSGGNQSGNPQQQPNPPQQPDPQQRTNPPQQPNPQRRPQFCCSKAAMDKARAAVKGKVPMGENTTQEELMAYHHFLEISRKHLEATLQELNERKQRADESSARRAALSWW